MSSQFTSLSQKIECGDRAERNATTHTSRGLNTWRVESHSGQEHRASAGAESKDLGAGDGAPSQSLRRAARLARLRRSADRGRPLCLHWAGRLWGWPPPFSESLSTLAGQAVGLLESPEVCRDPTSVSDTSAAAGAQAGGRASV